MIIFFFQCVFQHCFFFAVKWLSGWSRYGLWQWCSGAMMTMSVLCLYLPLHIRVMMRSPSPSHHAFLLRKCKLMNTSIIIVMTFKVQVKIFHFNRRNKKFHVYSFPFMFLIKQTLFAICYTKCQYILKNSFPIFKALLRKNVYSTWEKNAYKRNLINFSNSRTFH